MPPREFLIAGERGPRHACPSSKMNPDKLFDYLDGKLSPDERAELEEQLLSDPHLRRELTVARQIHAGGRESREEPLQSNREKFEAARIIKAAADKAVRLDPNSDLGWHVLGRWHMAIANVNAFERAMAQVAYGKLPESTYENAARCFQKAIELNPNRLMHYIELGRVYARMGRTADARIFITKGLAMRETEKDDAETKRQGQEVLATLRR